MEQLYTINHNLDIHNKIKRIDKYYQFSKDNTEQKLQDTKKWPDCLETILYQLDTQYNLLCLMPNNRSECTKYLMKARSDLMDSFVSNDLIKKYKYNTRAGMSKVNITKALDPSINSHAGLIFFSNYFELNIILVNREDKKYFHVKDPVPEQHYLMINLEDKEFIPPLSIGNYLVKKVELSSNLNNFTEVKKLVDITDTIESNIKNIKNIYKSDTVEKTCKKITDFKAVDLQNIAKANNISVKTQQGKRKTKAELYEELKDKI